MNLVKKTFFLIFLAIIIFLLTWLLVLTKSYSLAQRPNLSDLDVLYIERLPRYNFDAPKKWPDFGETVELKGHIKNNGDKPTGRFFFKWSIDGQEVFFGENDSLDPEKETTIVYQWSWPHTISSDGRIQGRHTVELIVDPEDEIGEISETNNNVKDLTQGLAVGFWVEQSVYNFFNQNQYNFCQDKSCAGSNSWEDWAQRQIREWNKLFEKSQYPSFPDGVLDRVRLDKVIVVADCTLPLNGGIADNSPDRNDKTVDLMWGFTSAKVGVIACPRDENDGNKNLYLNRPDLQNIEWPLMHELSHARYLIDTWAFNVKGEDVLVRDDGGNLIAGTPLLPYVAWNIVYYNKDQKIMGGGDYSKGYGEHSTGALNRVRGLRARKGNYNPPSVVGEYLNDLPSENKFQFLSKFGEPLVEAIISIYQAGPKSEWYGKIFDETPDVKKTSSENGEIILERNPFGGSAITHTFGSANGIFLFKIKYRNQVEYRFQEVSDFNLAYWRGETEEAIYSIRTQLFSLSDLKTLIENWGYSPSIPEADLNSDGMVNGMDFGMMLKLVQ